MWFDERGTTCRQPNRWRRARRPLMPMLFSIGIKGALEHLTGPCANLTECTLCTISSRPLCRPSLAFVFTRARRGRGTVVPLFQKTLRRSAPKHGSQLESEFLGHQSVLTICRRQDERADCHRAGASGHTPDCSGSPVCVATLTKRKSPCTRCRPQFP